MPFRPASHLSISIHALLAESDPFSVLVIAIIEISIHALLAESDPWILFTLSQFTLFLSTLSLRRATALPGAVGSTKNYFYPRSPCGERHFFPQGFLFLGGISIHALLAESDGGVIRKLSVGFLISIHALLAESDQFNLSAVFLAQISIHALLAESDL